MAAVLNTCKLLLNISALQTKKRASKPGRLPKLEMLLSLPKTLSLADRPVIHRFTFNSLSSSGGEVPVGSRPASRFFFCNMTFDFSSIISDF